MEHTLFMEQEECERTSINTQLFDHLLICGIGHVQSHIDGQCKLNGQTQNDWHGNVYLQIHLAVKMNAQYNFKEGKSTDTESNNIINERPHIFSF